MSKTHNCRNCGFVGHLYRDCPHPITSFGIICYRLKDDEPQYLMIQRKDSLSFMEFIRGKYDTHDIEYVKKLLSGMTHYERNLITSCTFEDLWNHVWYQPSIPRLTSEFESAKAKFQVLMKDLSHLLETSSTTFHEPEWGFPKGRRRLRENDMVCAIREFSEETGYTEQDIYVNASLAPFEEIFYGTNNILYRHVYYVAQMMNPNTDNPAVNPSNVNQAREVRDIRWFDMADTLSHIRDHNKERKDLFFKVHNSILEMKKAKQKST